MRNVVGDRFVHMCDHYDELVAAVSRDDIRRARQPDERVTYHLYRPIAGLVAIRVVDRFQAVYVDHQNCIAASGADRRLVLSLGDLRERAHVVEHRELVSVRQCAYAGFRRMDVLRQQRREKRHEHERRHDTHGIGGEAPSQHEGSGLQRLDQKIAADDEREHERRCAFPQSQRGRNDRQQVQVRERARLAAGRREHAGQKGDHDEYLDADLADGPLSEQLRVAEQKDEPGKSHEYQDDSGVSGNLGLGHEQVEHDENEQQPLDFREAPREAA